MKQHITWSQLRRISALATEKADKDFWPQSRVIASCQDLDPVDFNIGNMIEFLGVKDKLDIGHENLCDFLWEMVKEKLETRVKCEKCGEETCAFFIVKGKKLCPSCWDS